MLLSAGFLAESGLFPSLRNESVDPPEVPTTFRLLDCPRALPIGFIESIASLSTLALAAFSDAWKLLVGLAGGFAGGMCYNTLSDHFVRLTRVQARCLGLGHRDVSRTLVCWKGLKKFRLPYSI